MTLSSEWQARTPKKISVTEKSVTFLKPLKIIFLERAALMVNSKTMNACLQILRKSNSKFSKEMITNQ